MLRGFKRIAMVASTAGTLVVVSTLAVATTSVGSGPLKAVASSVTRLLVARPAIDASAGGGGGGGGVSSSSPGVTITIAPKATLTDRILVRGTLTTTCGPLFNFDGTLAGGTGFISVSQAAGHEVAFAGGSFSFTCAGVPESISYGATAFNVPFHPGGAVADASFFNVCGLISPFGFQFVCLNGDSGPVTITIQAAT